LSRAILSSMPLPVYVAVLGFLVLLVVGAIVTLVVVLKQSAKNEPVGEPLGGRESPLYLAAGPTGYGRGSGDEVIDASGLAEHPRHHPKK
jgi:hypothetical protein